ncbi:5-dehydro-4-deoxy-D-glucuronate isomerase [Portibacter marinus]|uniref:5-dehydro-4-deoxy-D-glucuronate isomerase n=1 Tax=Portibacter marinus TaxID=2898660 RepID=UPI001F3EFD8A|nr:5-dehydro-4-deoxy-D-glucuronate isomerase [Portibacter marinus]
MEQRYESHPNEVETMNTEELRENFLIEEIFEDGQSHFVYSHYDRMVVGGIVPLGESIDLKNYEDLKSEYFLERREIGIINVGGTGKISTGEDSYKLEKLSCLYIGKGIKNVKFSSDDAKNPAKFYCFSALAHAQHPTKLFTKEDALPVTLGSSETANERTIYKYIHNEGIGSCQVVMGLTVMHKGSVWNTMPPHTHDRRSEIYLYFDVPEKQGVMHFMGEPDQTRHMWVRNNQAIISPPWSIHAGSGTSSYSFIWAMAGENKDFTDMDFIELSELL